MSNIGFNCDVCGREVAGCTFVNGMRFCAKCYQETFGETEKDRKIADLEAKLSEKDQDKISFAIDKFEKVKENAWQSATDISCLLDYTELAKIIDNQIKQLKEGK